MAYVASGRLQRALDVTVDFHPFFGITLLSMLRSGVNTEQPIRWGSSEENELLDEYYRPAGSPPTKPYFIPFGQAEEHGYWRNSKYSAGSLQSARTREGFAAALHHPTRREWAFTANYVDVLAALLPVRDGAPWRIPVLDLAAWLFRDRDIPASLERVVNEFRTAFRIPANVFERLFQVIPEDEAAFFADEHVDAEDLRLLTGGVPEGPVLGDQSEPQLLEKIERYISTTENLRLPGRFIRSFYLALKSQRFVVLAGRPGTGKTAFARAFANALRDALGGSTTLVIVPIGQEQSEADTIGYAKIAGGLEPTELTKELFLSERRRDVFVVVLDEMNLGQVDYYLARLLPAIESDAPVELPGTVGRIELPPDSYFVGTINSFIEESSRIPLSGPVKRRANVIEMPNILDEIAAAGEIDGFRSFCRALLDQTLLRHESRQGAGTPSVLDRFRIENLRAAVSDTSEILHGRLLDLLWEIVDVCRQDPLTSLTAGVLQDVLDYAAFAGGETWSEILDRQIAQKVVPQLGGPKAVPEAIRAIIEREKTADTQFPYATAALDGLLATADPSSGLVYFKY